MRKQKKSMLILLSAAALAAAVSGCSSSSEPADESIVFTEAATEATSAGEAESDSAETTDPNGDTPTDEGYGILREASTSTIGSLNPLTYINSYSSTQIKRSSLALYTYFPNEDYTFCDLSGELAA